MPISWMPPSAIVAAMLSACAMLAFLVLLGRTSGVLRSPGPRFRFAVQSAWLLLGGLLVVTSLAGSGITIMDWAAAVAVMVAATVLAFIAWSLLAWGFTLNMLLVLASETRFSGIDDWVRSYTGGADLRRLTADRASVLLRARFAVVESEQGYSLTRRGRCAASLLGFGRWIFGIRSR